MGRTGRESERRAAVLYVSYDGILEPLGGSQVVAYVERLARSYAITLLSFEKARDARDPGRVSGMRERLAAAGVQWMPLRYHKWPPVVSTAFDVLRGVWHGWLRLVREPAHLIHARSYVASVIAVVLKAMFDIRFLFDMRGFWADEKVDAGQWARDSLIYKTAKRWEKRFFESADAIVSLTHEGVKAFGELGYCARREVPIEVIVTCADLERFSPGPKDPVLVSRFGLDGRVVVGCVGTMSGWYLRRPMLEYLSYLLQRIESARILIVTQEDHQQLLGEALRAEIPREKVVLARASFSEMPEYVRLIDLGVFFIKSCFSKRASCATKLAEFLATGVPVVINSGVGDSDRIVRENDVGVVIPTTVREDFAESLCDVRRLLNDPQAAERCRAAARGYFDVNEGAKKYASLYRYLIGSSDGDGA